MSEKVKYDIEVAGVGLTIVSDDAPEFVNSVVDKVNGRVREMMLKNRQCPQLDAALLCAIDYCGAALSAQNQIKNLEAQIALYSARVARLSGEGEGRRIDGEILPGEFPESASKAEASLKAGNDSEPALEEPMKKRLDSFRNALRSRHAEELDRLKTVKDDAESIPAEKTSAEKDEPAVEPSAEAADAPVVESEQPAIEPEQPAVEEDDYDDIEVVGEEDDGDAN